MDRFSREITLIGEDKFNILTDSHIGVFGIGGVGGYVCEALARAGVGEITLIDNDVVSKTNLNRQIVALGSTIGRLKTTVMKERILDINPSCRVHEINEFYLPENAHEFPLDSFDYIVDCIDTVSGKVSLIEIANSLDKKIISCMGTGNKIQGEKLKIADIYDTSVCPLARVIRKECKDRNIKKLKVLYSDEQPVKSVAGIEKTHIGRPVPSSISFVPSVAGLLIAGEVVRDIVGIN